MINDHKQHCKEVPARDTVTKLTEIFKNYGVQLEERWKEEPMLKTYSLRLIDKDSQCSTNGKGVTKDLARASAYAEFFERWQNGILCSADYESAKLSSDYQFNSSVDEKRIATKDLVFQNTAFLNWVFKERGYSNKSIEEKTKLLENLKFPFLTGHKTQGSFLCEPFFNIKKNDTEYLPKYFISYIYGSNGMSAGNTIEEATVQGLSEILERYVEWKIIYENIAPPIIPDSVIKKYPYIWNMYKAIDECEDYEIMLKDCSLSGKYPVVALVVIHKNTGRYGVHFGCHPSFAIAMERTFTEAAQGLDSIAKFADIAKVDFTNNNQKNWTNIRNLFCNGVGSYNIELLGKEESYPFNPCKDLADLNNAEMAKNMINSLLQDGWDVLIRNVSYFGFVSVHIIVPGMTETVDVASDKYLMNRQMLHQVKDWLKEPSKLTRANYLQICSCINFFIKENGMNSLGALYDWADFDDFPLEGDSSAYATLYLCAMSNIMLKRYKAAANQIKAIVNSPHAKKWSNNTIIFLKCIRHYCLAYEKFDDIEKVYSYLDALYDDVCTQKLRKIFEGGPNCIYSQYPTFNKDKISKKFIGKFNLNEKLKAAMLNNPIDQKQAAKSYSFTF